MRTLEIEKTRRLPFEAGFPPALEWDSDMWLNIVDGLPNPIIIYKSDGSLVFANRRAAALFGLEEPAGALPDYLYPLVKSASRLGLYSRGREVSVPLDGGDLPMLLTEVSLGSERVICAAGMLRPSAAGGPLPEGSGSLGESMAVAGEMSERVRGPLAGIELYASILGEELDGDQGLSELIDEIRYSVREANECLTSVESMTRPLTLELHKASLSGAVDGALEALEGLFKARGVGVLVEQRELPVEADRALITQMFLNILINAAEAMPRGGRLLITEEVNDAGEAVVIFEDTGPGVAASDLGKVWNPFYTTKSQPLGLGLPVSRRIAEAHQGRIVFGLAEGGGARVKVVLPHIPASQDGGPLN